MRAFTWCFGVFVCLLGIICAIFELQLIFRIIVAVLAYIAVVLVLKYSKCPHCGKYGININPFSHKFGICKKCSQKETEIPICQPKRRCTP